MKTLITALALSTSLLATASTAEIIGTYLRAEGDPVLAHIESGLLFCTRVSDGYEICNGMAQQESGAWSGEKLKNPDMPGFMKFAGSIVFTDTQMELEGCTMGGSVCKSQIWPAQP